MGYTTTFRGSFKITPALSYGDAAELRARINDEEWPDEVKADIPPRSCCQWIPTKDRAGLEWDGGEKFYHYDDWLSFLAAFLKPKGYTVSGSVVFRGESRDDVGTLAITDGVVTKLALAPQAWAEVPKRARDAVIDKMKKAWRDSDGDEESDAWVAALAALGVQPAS